MIELRGNEKVEDLQCRGLKIIQNKDWFCFGMDAVLLANYCDIKDGEEVVDLGTGTGIIPILIYGKNNVKKIYGLELQKEVAEMAKRSIVLNSLEKYIEIVNENVKDYKKHLKKNHFDTVVTNPPYIQAKNNLVSPKEKKAISKHEIEGNLEDFIKTASELLKHRGKLYMVYRPNRLVEVFELMKSYKIEPKNKVEGNNIMAIDLGLNNLATLTFKDNVDNYIINGKSIKSKNSYFNKEITKLQAVRMKQTGSKKFKDTKKIKKLRTKRNNYILDYLHKASRKIINLAKKHQVSKIIIGDIKQIKQNMNYNKSFVQVPIQRLKELIEYKAKLEGIKVVFVNEAYTSGCSAMDLETLNRDNYNKSRRIERGLFKSNIGLTINADVNGSLNIMRKFLNKECIPELVNQARDNGVVDPPSRLRIA